LLLLWPSFHSSACTNYLEAVMDVRSEPTTAAVDRTVLPVSYVQWRPAIAGGLVAAAAFFVLMTFATAMGLAVASTSPTWRDTSVGLVVLSGAWVVLTAIGSFALGGYIAGRVRSSWRANADEVHFRDGLHGLLVWSIAIVIGVGLTWASATTVSRSTINNVARPTSNQSGTNAGEPSFLTFELDRLFRSTSNRQQTSNADTRAEAGRIIERALGKNQLTGDDRDYLVHLVSTQAGLPAADADHRVAQVITESRDASRKARQSAVVLAFTIAAALAAAAAAAWGAAIIGGRHRDENITPSMRFSWGLGSHRA
jgi:hypothetical protein